MSDDIPVMITGTTTHSDAPDGAIMFKSDNFGAPMFLHLTGRLAKRAMNKLLLPPQGSDDRRRPC